MLELWLQGLDMHCKGSHELESKLPERGLYRRLL